MNLFKCVVVLLFLLIQVKGIHAEIIPAHKNQSLIKSFCRSPIAPEELPFIPLTDYKNDCENSVYQAGIDYFNSQPDLISRIRSDLGGGEMRWELSDVSHRLVYLPEDRAITSEWYIRYCRNVIQDLLRKTGLEDPYSSIEFPNGELPGLDSVEGVKALIVQDMGREYESQYCFSGKGRQKAMIRISGRILVNEVGSYSSYVQYSNDTGKWEVARDPFTIWKSRAKNPFSVLVAPVEETLHIGLREYTEKAILQALENIGEKDLEKVSVLVDEWLAIEEAVVGGLVEAMAPDLIGIRFPDHFERWHQAGLATKSKFKKYRYLDMGIRMVRSLGIRESCLQYAANPENLKQLLSGEDLFCHKEIKKSGEYHTSPDF